MAWTEYVIPNVTDFGSMIAGVEVSSGGLLGTLIFMAVYVLPYIWLAPKWESSDAILATSVFASVMCMLFTALGGMNTILLNLSVLILAASFTISLFGGRR